LVKKPVSCIYNKLRSFYWNNYNVLKKRIAFDIKNKWVYSENRGNLSDGKSSGDNFGSSQGSPNHAVEPSSSLPGDQ
jgi:hypothetical protein